MAESIVAENDVAEINQETPAAKALTHLQTLLATAGLDVRVTPEASDGDNANLAVNGPDAALLVGPQGQTLDALQYLLMLMTNKGQAPRLRVTVDADGYRARRTQRLVAFAQELAAEVAKTGQEAITDTLNPMERRIIHTALVDNPDVETYSEGEEPSRYVVITPRQGGG